MLNISRNGVLPCCAQPSTSLLLLQFPTQCSRKFSCILMLWPKHQRWWRLTDCCSVVESPMISCFQMTKVPVAFVSPGLSTISNTAKMCIRILTLIQNFLSHQWFKHLKAVSAFPLCVCTSSSLPVLEYYTAQIAEFLHNCSSTVRFQGLVSLPITINFVFASLMFSTYFTSKHANSPARLAPLLSSKTTSSAKSRSISLSMSSSTHFYICHCSII